MRWAALAFIFVLLVGAAFLVRRLAARKAGQARAHEAAERAINDAADEELATWHNVTIAERTELASVVATSDENERLARLAELGNRERER